MKTTTKTLLCLLLVAVVALSLFACGKTDVDPADTDQKAEGTQDKAPDTSKPDGTSEQGDTKDPDDTGKVEDDSAEREEFFSRDQLVIYPELPEQIHRNYDYKVTVTQGTETHPIPVYNHVMEYEVSDRSIGGDLYRRFSQFAFSGKQVRIDIKVNRDFEYYSVFPSAKNFKTEYNGGTISVYLDKPDYFGIRLDDDDNSILSVFADLPEFPGDIPSKTDKNVIFIEGWHDVEGGILYSKVPNTHLYIAPGAVLNGRIDMRGAKSKITGRGVILDAFENIYKLDIRVGGTETHGIMLCQFYSDGGIYDGPVLMDARCFNLMTGSNVTVRNYKALSSMMTTDGITAGGKNATFEHCWIYCGDNAIVSSGAENHTYRDIALGTTCAALFPQNGSVNLLFDNMYVFRSNDGVFTNRYNGGDKPNRAVEITVNNLDCMDCINVNRFFQGGNMGLLKKTIVFNGLSLPNMTGVTNLHKSNIKETKNILAQFTNPGDLVTENYHLTFNNLYIGGNEITDVGQVIIDGDYNNTVTVKNDGTYEPVKRVIYNASYKGTNKVYIGEYLMGFENEVLWEDDGPLLPVDEILAALRSAKQPETLDRGMPYCTPDALLKAGAIEKFEIDGNGSLRLTPVYNGRSLLLPDEGVLPQICEASAFKVDMVTEDNDGDYIYYLYDLRNYYAGGFSIMFTEEIKKYGAGTYEFKFRARGSSSGGITIAWRYDDETYYSKNDLSAMVGSSWKEYSITLKVDEAMLQKEMFAVSVLAAGTPMEYFAVKELELIKTK